MAPGPLAAPERHSLRGRAYVSVVVLAVILGAHDYGGFRAIQAIFTPLTLIGPAIALPGLPLVSRALRDSRRRAQRIALRLGLAASAMTAVYVVALVGLPGIVTFFFGSGFTNFQSMILRFLGLSQVVLAPTRSTLLLRAEQRGRMIVVLSTSLSGVSAAGRLGRARRRRRCPRRRRGGVLAGVVADIAWIAVALHRRADAGESRQCAARRPCTSAHHTAARCALWLVAGPRPPARRAWTSRGGTSRPSSSRL